MKPVALLALGLALSGQAIAQQAPASSTADVLADIEPALLQFEIQVVSPMSFGSVRIPRAGNSVCRYILGPDAGIAVREFTKSGEPVSATAPTPAGCSQSGEGAAAMFGIGCAPGEAIQYDITHTSAGRQGLSFSSTAGGSPNVLRIVPVADGASAEDRSAAQGSFACPASGQVSARIAGQLNIDDAAETGTGVNVGQVTLAVRY